MPQIWTAAEMKNRYGKVHDESAQTQLDPVKVPEKFRNLIHYAAFWGYRSVSTVNDVVERLDDESLSNLFEVVWDAAPEVTDWLAGDESANIIHTNEYIAYSSLVSAGEYALIVLRQRGYSPSTK